MELMRIYGDNTISILEYNETIYFLNLDTGEGSKVVYFADPLQEVLLLVSCNRTERIDCNTPFLDRETVIEEIETLNLNLNIELLINCLY